MISNFSVTENIAKYLYASFWVTMTLGDGSKNSILRADAINYKIYNDNHVPIPFWQNTQTLIYQTVKEKASLMSLLFSTLNNKRSIHILSEVGTQNELSIAVQINEYDDISVNIIFPLSFVEEEQFDYTTICYNNLKDIIDIGYDFAQNHFISNKTIERIHNIATKVSKELNRLLPCEDIDHLYKLSIVAIAYIYPTSNFKGKSFSTILCKFRRDGYTEVSSGGLFLLWNDIISVSSINNIIQNDIGFLRLRLIANQFCSDVTTAELLKQSQKKSIQSAVAAIMSRNMSHNLGSHYLYYTKTHLEKLAAKGGDLGPDIRGAARVLGYMQARMDYLSTMISNDRYSYAGVNLKSQIFDELTIDDFSKRHFYNELSDTEWYEKNNDDVIELDNSLRAYLKNLTGETKAEKIKEKRDRIKHLKEDVVKKLNLLDGIVKNNRTTNFLLTNLIYSENFSRMDIMDRTPDGPLNQLKLCVRYKGEDSKYATFTGEAGAENEETLKSTLSMMNVALPGGVMSCHAFFNVLENFIRNSAKYLQDDFVEVDGCKLLKITIAIEETIDEEDGCEYYIFNIYDNKANAKKSDSSLYDSLTERLKSLVILDDDNGLDKSDKGFKEMLFSSIWLRSYMFNKESINGEVVTCADIITRIQNASPDERIAMIEDYAFKLIAVNDDMNNETITVYDRETINACSDENLNLGISIKLPKFKRCVELDVTGSKDAVMNRCLNIYGDIVLYDPDEISTSQTEIMPMRWFPRALQVNSLKLDSNVANDIKMFEQILKNRFEDYENYVLCFDDLNEEDIQVFNKFRIYYQRHLSSQEDLNQFKLYEYADSVSGGNFTITLAEWFKEWYNRGRKKDEIMYYQILKIKESALTRITMIDERIHKDMQTKGTDVELACKNIRVLNYREDCPNASLDDLMSIFEGNSFKDNTNKTHFLSIHLGLIEKIVQNNDLFKNITCKDTIEGRAEYLMSRIKDVFGNDAFISVHSGRGNFSKDLSISLVEYPFIGLASLESAYNNSKYLLSQLFYNTVYIGKGRLNKEHHGKV